MADLNAILGELSHDRDAISLCPHRRSDGDADQQTFWEKKSTGGLPPRFLFVTVTRYSADSSAHSRFFDTFHIEFKLHLGAGMSAGQESVQKED